MPELVLANFLEFWLCNYLTKKKYYAIICTAKDSQKEKKHLADI